MLSQNCTLTVHFVEKFGYLGWPYEDKVKGDTGQCDTHTDQGIQGS